MNFHLNTEKDKPSNLRSASCQVSNIRSDRKLKQLNYRCCYCQKFGVECNIVFDSNTRFLKHLIRNQEKILDIWVRIENELPHTERVVNGVAIEDFNNYLNKIEKSLDYGAVLRSS